MYTHLMPKIPTVKYDSVVEMKLEEITTILRRMDKRDRMRTWGGLFRSLLAIIPLIIFLWSIWYFAGNWDTIMKQVADQAASSAAEYTKDQSQGMLERFMEQNTP